ncbi:MAG: DNA polymerase III subunit beta [Thermomicrobiales bacterium]
MKLTVARSDFRPALSMVAKTAAGKTTIPILGNVLMTAEDDTLTLFASDLTTGIRRTIPAQVETPGSLTVEPSTLSEWLGIENSAELHIEHDAAKGRATIKAGRARASFATIPAEDFPVIRMFQHDDTLIDLPAQMLRRAIELTSFAVASPTSGYASQRPTMTGVIVAIKDNVAEVSSTDGFRMSRYLIEGQFESDAELTVVLPVASVRALVGLIGDETRTVTMSASSESSLVSARVDGIEWVSAVIAGDRVNINATLSTATPTRATVDRSVLHAALRGVRSLAKSNHDTVILDVGEETLTLKAVSSEYGDAETTIDAVVQRGDDFEEGERLANAARLADIVGTLNLARVTLGMGDSPKEPMHVTDPSVPHFRHIIAALVPNGRG